VLTLILRDWAARESVEGRTGEILDYDGEGRLVVIEILDASNKVEGVDLVQLQVTPKPAVAAE
jgi:uncharacterized protein YuzE